MDQLEHPQVVVVGNLPPPPPPIVVQSSCCPAVLLLVVSSILLLFLRAKNKRKSRKYSRSSQSLGAAEGSAVSFAAVIIRRPSRSFGAVLVGAVPVRSAFIVHCSRRAASTTKQRSVLLELACFLPIALAAFCLYCRRRRRRRRFFPSSFIHSADLPVGQRQ